MKLSPYFSNLHRAYSDEIDDLLTDSEGKSVLRQRLAVKRREIAALLPMIEFSPEMVAAAYFDAFGFSSAAMMQSIARSEPGMTGFVSWGELSKNLVIAPWALPLVEAALKVEGGGLFLVTTATLEYLRGPGGAGFAVAPAQSEAGEQATGPGERDAYDERDEYSGNDPEDLAEAGADWLAEQGFETTGQ